jgi:hypothetical protein
MSHVVQMKLVTGEEILCTFSDKNESTPDSFMVHSVLQMMPIGEPSITDETESYILRPYITYVDNLQREVSINPVTVVCVSYPSTAIEAQYFISLAEIEKQLGYNVPEEPSQLDSDQPQSGNVVTFPFGGKQILTED